MDTRIELERRGREPAKVSQLTLDNCRTNSTNGISEKLAAYSGLNTLSMINAGLTSLKGFPSLPMLRKLDISDNRITGGLNHIADACPRIESLNLGGNRIKDVDTLEPLRNLKELRHLDMYNCDITGMEDYQEKIFLLLPQLADLDGFDRDRKEVFEEDDEDDFGSGDGEEEEEEGAGESEGENDLENGDGESDSNDMTNGGAHHAIRQEEDDDEEDDDEDDDEDEEEDEGNEDDESDGDDDVQEIIPNPIPLVDLSSFNPEAGDDDEEEDDDDDDEEEEEEDQGEDNDEDADGDGDENNDEEDDNGDLMTSIEEISSTPADQRGQKRVHSDDEEDGDEDDEEDDEEVAA